MSLRTRVAMLTLAILAGSLGVLQGCKQEGGGSTGEKKADQKPKDTQGREWTCGAKFNPVTGWLTIEASIVNGPNPDRGVLTEFDAWGIVLVTTERGHGISFSGKLPGR